jgi:hypothetical protein
MTMRTRALAWLAFLAALAPASDAMAFCRSTTCTGECPRDENDCKTTGKQLFWAGGCVGFSLQEDSSVHIPMKYFRQVAQRSFLAWTELECDSGISTLSFAELDEVSCKKTEYNSGGANANIILFQDNKWDYAGVDNTLAKTTVTFDDDTGEILDADIEINHAYNQFTINDDLVEYDLESVLTHEVGHFIGLDHSPDFSATMFAGYEPGTTEQRTLEEDDILAACAVYPPERAVTCNTEPRGGFATECGGKAAEKPEEDGGEDEGCTVAGAGTRPREAGGPSAVFVLGFVWALGTGLRAAGRRGLWRRRR